MKPKVNKHTCIGCGICPVVAPGIFIMNGENIAEVVDEKDYISNSQKIDEAIRACPVNAISKDE